MKLLRDNGLTIVLLLAFLGSIVGMAGAGFELENQSLQQHGLAPMQLLEYLTSGAFLSGVFENWESEFLQMAAYVVLTAYLFQRGSAESKDPDGPEEVDQDPADNANDQASLFLFASADSGDFSIRIRWAWHWRCSSSPPSSFTG